MRVLILTQEVGADAPPEERDVLVQAAAVHASLETRGHRVSFGRVGLDLRELLRHLDERPDVAFNLVESLGGRDDLQSVVPYALELLGIPYTGCPAVALGESNNKPATKRRLASLGLRTPPWAAWKRDVEYGTLTYHGSDGFLPGRYIVKPVSQHASYGIDDEAVTEAVPTPARLVELLGARQKLTNVECFAEHFVDGREVNLALLGTSDGPHLLGFAEIEFSGFAKSKPRIVGHAAKWDEDSFEYTHTHRRFWGEGEETQLRGLLSQLAMRCWSGLHLDGAARIDFRVDSEGRPWILEVNANPCLSPDAGFMAAAEHSGLRSIDVFEGLIDRALVRAARFES